MSNLLLQSLATMTRASEANLVAKIHMTEKQVSDLTAKLKRENRMNVYANKFDVKKPYRVQTRNGRDFIQHGYFTNIDVASAVGTICSKAKFKEKALAGNFDAAVVAEHPEFEAWMADERNQEVIALASETPF